jgi:hypothetical protein
MKYILARNSHSAGQVYYVRRFNGAGTPQVVHNIIDAFLFDDKEEVAYLLEDLNNRTHTINFYKAIELTDKDVFEMRLKGLWTGQT